MAATFHHRAVFHYIERGGGLIEQQDRRILKQCAGNADTASFNLACRNICPDFSATFTTIAFDNNSLRWLEINT